MIVYCGTLLHSFPGYLLFSQTAIVSLAQSEYEIVDDFSGYKPGADGFGHSDHKHGPVKSSSGRLVMFTVHATWPGPGPVPNYINPAGYRSLHKILAHEYRLAN